MTSQVTELERPTKFVDEQVSGPFRRFHHTPEFMHDRGATEMVDRVRFDAPLGPVGDLVERLILGRYLEELIVDRGKYLKLVAESDDPPDRR